MGDPILLAKCESAERCVVRARAALLGSQNFLGDLDAQDIAVINVIRACEACIDIALRLIKLNNLGLPSSNRDGFFMLSQNTIIVRGLAEKLTKMVGFRNVAVHEYTKLNYQIVESVIRDNLDDILTFVGIALVKGVSKT
jgi:uncharacterized protein YutE (UPF0331/DUF86 family)